MTEPFGTELITDPDAILDPDDEPLPPHQAAVVGVLTHRYPDLAVHDLIETSGAVVYALDKAGLLGTDKPSMEQKARLQVFDRLGMEPIDRIAEFIGKADDITTWVLTGQQPKPDGDGRTVGRDATLNRALVDLAAQEVGDMLSGVDTATFVSVHAAALRRVLETLGEMSAPV
jgi:hypothetical protein